MYYVHMLIGKKIKFIFNKLCTINIMYDNIFSVIVYNKRLHILISRTKYICGDKRQAKLRIPVVRGETTI